MLPVTYRKGMLPVISQHYLLYTRIYMYWRSNVGGLVTALLAANGDYDTHVIGPLDST